MIPSMLIASFVTSFLGVVVFLFLFWRRLKDDYASETIFKTAFAVLAGIFVGFLVSLRFSREGFFWMIVLGGLAGLGISIRRIKIKFYESFEALILSSIPWLALIFLSDSVIHSSLISFLAFLAMLIFIFIFYFLDLHYKTFTWYRSGKIGFAGLATLTMFFICRFLLAIFKVNVISFLKGRTEIEISAGAAVVCLLLVYNLTNDKK